jgi:beta-glucosidase
MIEDSEFMERLIEEKQEQMFDPPVEDILGQMTLEEKVGQTVLGNAGAEDILAAVRTGKVGAVICDNLEQNNTLQRTAMEQSRLGIPLLIGADVIHGYRTTFPIPLAESCSWNLELLERAAAAAAAEAATMGVNWIYAPMVDISRDPRWGRIAEGAGEDPFLGRAIAQARVRGFQNAALPGGRRIAACPKHFAAYGFAEGGRDYNTVDISERTLREICLPPFKAAFEAGAQTVMTSFNEISGVPSTSSNFLLKTVLRQEWQMNGVVVSDYNAIGELIHHGVAKDLREAARLSILAGVDIDMASDAYALHLAELVQSGEVPMEVLDRSVRRILGLKLALGLFEQPFTDDSLADQVILSEAHRELALEVAHQSVVLVKNDAQLLPLQPNPLRIALIGPLAKNQVDLLGCWASAGRPEDVETIYDGFRRYLPEEDILFQQGCSLAGEDAPDLVEALETARQADVIILAVGESREMSGEAHSRVHLGLPGRQQELADALAELGKPLVVLVLSGRPLVIPELASEADALLLAWHGGIRAGQAVADIIFGAANPIGKLTTSWPRAEGQIPVYYAHKATGRPPEGKGTTQFIEPYRSRYMDEPNEPLFAFGQGLSYSTFEYSQLEILTPIVRMDESLKVCVRIKNTSMQTGTEVAQLYIRDLTASVTRPVRELKGFTRLGLNPGEEQVVTFEVPAHELGFIGLENKYIVEPGCFRLWVGPDSTTGLEGEFELI